MTRARGNFLTDGNPFYADRGPGGHTCKKLGRLRFTDPVAQAAPAGNVVPSQVEALELAYGPWEMAWPHMLRQAHSDWFNGYEIANWRRNS